MKILFLVYVFYVTCLSQTMAASISESQISPFLEEQILAPYNKRKDTFNQQTIGGQHHEITTHIRNLLLDPNYLSKHLYARTHEKKLLMQAIIADSIMNMFDQNGFFSIPKEFEEQNTPAANHFKIMMLTEKIAKQAVMSRKAHSQQEPEWLETTYQELEQLSGINRESFNQWFEETLNEHEEGLNKLLTMNQKSAFTPASAISMFTDERYSQLTEKQRVDRQFAQYDTLYNKYKISNFSDYSTMFIPEYSDIARSGIAYVRYHYQHKDIKNIQVLTKQECEKVLRRCDDLENELNDLISQQDGLTPLQFVSFNHKLAAIQEVDSTRLAFSLNQLNLDRDKWEYHPKTTDDKVLLAPHFSDPEYWVFNLIQGQALRDVVETFYSFPYVIYTPKGGFSVKRLVTNMLLPEHHYSVPLGLPIGKIADNDGPHNEDFTDPINFLNHDYQHSMIFYPPSEKNLNTARQLDLNNPVVTLIAYYAFHEGNSRSDLFLPLVLKEHNALDKITQEVQYQITRGSYPIPNQNYKMEADALIRVLANNQGISQDQLALFKLHKENEYKDIYIQKIDYNDLHSGRRFVYFLLAQLADAFVKIQE